MAEKFILCIDQKISATKALLFDSKGALAGRCDLPHRQVVSEQGWLEYDANEIYKNTLAAVKDVIESAGVNASSIVAASISNQREAALVWDRSDGLPVHNAIAGRCDRAAHICARIREAGHAAKIKEVTGLFLSPYFPAAKIAWILENVGGLEDKSLCCGTIDSWLVFKLTGGFKTDYSNASRTQLLDLTGLCWSREICGIFGIDIETLPELTDSDGDFGKTDFAGLLPEPVPICGVLGNSQSVLFAQGCLSAGMIKATYAASSSVMMNIGENPVYSDNIMTSLAWKMGGKVCYALEGNIRYAGAVIKWLVEDIGMIASPNQTSGLASEAKDIDGLYLVPAFCGLGAPHWDSKARAIICGMDARCGKAEIVRAAEEAIAYQVTDILRFMKEESGMDVKLLRVDGAATSDEFLMQVQADIANVSVIVSNTEELSGMGAAYAAGISAGLYDKTSVLETPASLRYLPGMDEEKREAKYAGWKNAVRIAAQNNNT